MKNGIYIKYENIYKLLKIAGIILACFILFIIGKGIIKGPTKIINNIAYFDKQLNEIKLKGKIIKKYKALEKFETKRTRNNSEESHYKETKYFYIENKKLGNFIIEIDDLSYELFKENDYVSFKSTNIYSANDLTVKFDNIPKNIENIITKKNSNIGNLCLYCIGINTIIWIIIINASILIHLYLNNNMDEYDKEYFWWILFFGFICGLLTGLIHAQILIDIHNFIV